MSAYSRHSSLESFSVPSREMSKEVPEYPGTRRMGCRCHFLEELSFCQMYVANLLRITGGRWDGFVIDFPLLDNFVASMP